MKKRIAALALALTLSGCGRVGAGTAPAKPETTAAAAEQLLSLGYYRVEDEDGAETGYLRAARRLLILYEADGTERERLSYSYDPARDVYLVDGEEAFTVEAVRRTLHVTDLEVDAVYVLHPIDRDELPDPAAAPAETEPPAPALLSGEEIYSLAMPSTVDITAVVTGSLQYTGTGFFIDENGTVVTNYHVIEGARSAYVTTSGGQEYDVTAVAGYDPDLDLAILRTGVTGSAPLALRTEGVTTGETVYALGSSLGLVGTFSNGIVSAASREYDDGHTYIQHTAAISHGNSGGPLLDRTGSVIGVNCAYIVDGQNLNLAIPVSELARLDTAVPVTLESLAEDAYGSREYTSLDTSDWEELYIAGVGDHYLAAALPPVLADSLEINEEETGVTASWFDDTSGAVLWADVMEGDFGWMDEEELDAHSDELTELLVDGVRDMDFEPGAVESAAWYINGTPWRAYAAAGSGDGMELTAYMLLTFDEDTAFLVLLFTLYETGADEAAAALDEMAAELFSSLWVEVG